MASQYDSIGSKYSVFKEIITSRVEEANIKKAVLPYLGGPDTRVLDLASGTGHYSKKAIDWGAGYVLGVDLSKGMVEAARQDLLSDEDDRYRGRVRFQVGDALGLGRVDGEAPFDVVLGAWLLNYASGLEEMTAMFRTVAANLRDDGGVFVGLTPPAADDVDALAARLNAEGRQESLPEGFPIRVDYYERLASGDGWRTEVSSTAAGERVSFRNFHLRKGLYEEGARRAGLRGRLEWPEIEIPEAVREVLVSQGWEAYLDGDQIGILIVEK